MKHDEQVIAKISKEMKAACDTMTANEARYMLGMYLTMQDDRKAADQKIGKMTERDKGEPHAVLQWVSDNAFAMERQVLSALNSYAESQPMGKWALGICGVGPVVAAGLLAHVDIEECPTAGHLWRFAGLDPSAEWKSTDECEKWIKANGGASEELIEKAAIAFGRKAETIRKFATTDMEGKPIKLTTKSLAKSLSRRPHNAALKQICFYVGESFIKVKKNESDFYGKLYEQRKAYEHAKNDAGDYAEFAAKYAEKRPTHAQIKTYKAGKLPDGHLHSRARRWAIKLFLAHWFEEAYWQHYGKEAPMAYPIAIQKHAHYIPRPNPRFEMTPDDRTWFEKWQAKRIGSRKNRKEFQILHAVNTLADMVEPKDE